MIDELNKIWKVLNRHEQKISKLQVTRLIKTLLNKKFKQSKQEDRYHGIHLALVVDTGDPWKQNRIRFFSPVLHIPEDQGVDRSGYAGGNLTTQIEQCDWASPCSALGGFDDSGCSWVPPVGSTVCILFQNANPKSAFYMGTTWQRYRGPENQEVWNYNIPEYNKLFRGHRKGYMVGANDESQVFPPGNTDNYQGYDYDSRFDIDFVPDASEKTTWPHQKVIKTEEKHTIILDDGDPKCNRRWKRIQVMSSLGHLFLMKDDPYHHCGEWVNPKCTTQFYDTSPVSCLGSYKKANFPNEISLIPNIISTITNPNNTVIDVLYACPQGPENCPTLPEEPNRPVDVEYLGNEHLCPGFQPPTNSKTMPADCLDMMQGAEKLCFSFNNEGRNKYHKQKQECFPFLAGRCALVQSGMQLLSRSQATLVFDDSVEEPRETPEWERALQPFDMDGCTGCFKGRTFLRSATGHYLLMDDSEDQPKIRGRNNGVTLGTACGNVFKMSDWTLANGIAGPGRGVHIGSTANMTIDLCDDGNIQSSPERDGCAKTGAWSKQAFIRLRTGYGIQVLMSDSNDQTQTDQQHFQILCPQKSNLQRGAHIFHMQERATGPGQIFVKAGGDYIVQTYDDMIEVVGDEKDNPSNKLEFVSNQKIVSVKDVYYNRAKTHVFHANDFIFLTAGQDCGEGSCIFPVVVATTGIPEHFTAMTGLKASERVFASATQPPCDPCDYVASDS